MFDRPMIIFMHNRYRTTGGEERAVEDFMRLVEEELREPARLLSRDSSTASKARAAAALLRGGERPKEVAAAVRLAKARILHAHNLHPLLGWRSLAAARAAGAKVVLHLHQYRLVCAVGVCFTAGERCTRCHARNTLPGVIRNCRGSYAEALSYAAALSLSQRRICELADATIVPSAFARERLMQLGAPLDFERLHVVPPPLRALAGEEASAGGEAPADDDALAREDAMARENALRGDCSPQADRGYALVVSRLAPEKGIEVAIDACRLAGRTLLVAGDGPQRDHLRRYAAGADVRFLGAVPEQDLSRLRAKAALALVPSRSDETFGIAAAEAMAAGLPVLASRVGALPELLRDDDALVEPGDTAAMATAIQRLWGDAATGARNRAIVAQLCAPQAVAGALAEVYRSVCAAAA
jgi:glycosyltransferase involved in cell wall biosynthesis